jgi:hypothetical protein
MVCEKYVARINIPVPLHHEEPMNCKNDYFSYMIQGWLKTLGKMDTN